MTKPTRETIRKRIATRNASIRKRKREARRYDTMGGELAAAIRLERDGAESSAAMQRRVRVLAQGRNLPPADYAKLMRKRVLTGDMLAFCKKHKVSIDWLMCGDLKGLQRTIQERVFQPAPAFNAKRFAEKYRSLPPEAQKIIEQTVDRLLEQR